MTEYDQITRDLTRKAIDDVAQALWRTTSLHQHVDGKIAIAIGVASTTLTIAATMIQARHGCTADEAVKELLAIITPSAIDCVQSVINHPS